MKDAKNVAIVDGSTGAILGRANTLARTSPPPILLSKILRRCLYGIPPHLVASHPKALERRSFDTGDVRFSLIRDSGTESAISSSSNLTSSRLGKGGEPLKDISQIESAFQTAKGKTVIMISHVEGTNSVFRDPAGNVVSSIPIESVRILAKKYNIQLIDLGCQTAQQIEADTLELGVTTNSIRW